jgi:hypothetical protein
MNTIAHWLENHLLACPYKSLTGIDCPGCGMQRSFVELIKGNFIESFFMYPALIPVMFTLCLTALHLKFKFANGANYIKYSFIVSVFIIMVNYILKFIL